MIIKLISFLLRQSRRVFFLVVIGGVLSGLASTALLSLVNRALNRDGINLNVVGLAFAGLCALLAITRVYSHHSLIRLGEDTVLRIRLELVRRILGTPLAKLEGIGTHRLMACLSEDTASIANTLVLLPIVGINSLIVVCSLIYLAWLSPLALPPFLLATSVSTICFLIPGRRAIRCYRLARQEEDELFRQFRSLGEGSKELKLHAPRRIAFVALVRRTAESLREWYIKGASAAAVVQVWAQLFVFFSVGWLIFVLPQLQTIQREVISGYAMVLFYIAAPLQLLVQLTPRLTRGAVALERLEEMGLSLDLATDWKTVAAPSAWKRLELSGVTYRYRGKVKEDDFALGPIDLVFEPGQLVFIVGGNGSGKTTLAKIISGLYSPDAGEIRLDGWHVNEEGLDDYRQLFSMVFSDFCLFDRFLGLEHPDLDRQAHEYLVNLRLDGKVSVKNGELSTVDLSSGQRKRLALLTAYLEDRPICIFDEWAADQDPIFRQIFYYDILRDLKAKGKTVLVISHDDRYFHLADRIIKLEEGQLVAYENFARPSQSECPELGILLNKRVGF